MTKRRAAASALLVFFASASVYSICLIGAGPVYAASRQALFPAESSLFTQANAGTLGSPLLAESRTVPNPNTWLPDFVDGNTLYVDSRLTTLSVANQSPIKFSAGLAAEVERLARRNDLRFFVVVTEKGADLVGERRTWASSLLRNQLWRRWTANPAFARDASRAVVLLMVRDNQDVGKFSVALRVGGELNNLGLNPQLFSSQTGPILPAMKSHLPSDPEQCLLSVLENVNELVSGARSASSPERQTASAAQAATSSSQASQVDEALLPTSTPNPTAFPMKLVLALLGLGAGFFLLRGLSQSGSSQNSTERSLPQPGTVDSNEGDGEESLDGRAPLLGHMLPEQARRRQERENERLNRRNRRQSGRDFSDSTPLYIPDSTPSQPHSPSPGHHDGPSSGGGSGCASSGCAGSSCGGSSCGGGGGCGS